MKKKSNLTKVNSEYHHIGGKDILKSIDKRFIEYRKKWNEWPTTFHIGSFPLFIDIECTNACNLRCPFCSKTVRSHQNTKNKFMSFKTVKKIIDEGKENNLYGVKFSITGEPLLHPEISNFAKYAKDNGLIDVYFNTNATLLKPHISRKLIESGLDRISISFEGSTKEVYEKYRVGAKFENVVSNIRNFQEIKKEMGIDYPKVRIQTVLLPELIPEIETYKKFWLNIVDEIGFLDYQPRVDKKDNILKGKWACSQLWQRLGILVDGTIIPCNHDEYAKNSLGNIQNTTIKKAWHSEKLNSLRNIHIKGEANLNDACRFCYLRYSELKKMKEG